MTYINDKNFVHRVFHTIEKEVNNETIKKKLHEYFTKNVHQIDYNLFLTFSRAIGQIRKLYDQNVKFSNTFVLTLLTYLHEAKNVFPSNTDTVDVFINRFMKKIPESERVTIVFGGFDNFQCLYYLALKLQMLIGTSINVEEQDNTRREERHTRNDRRNNTSERRYRSRSSRSNNNNRRNPNRIIGSHLTEEQRLDFDKQRTEEEIRKREQRRSIPPPPPGPPPQHNADEMISRLVHDNHSLYNAIRERDNTIMNLQNEIIRLRQGRNI
jgi:hypothetical protein